MHQSEVATDKNYDPNIEEGNDFETSLTWNQCAKTRPNEIKSD